jgi:integrase
MPRSREALLGWKKHQKQMREKKKIDAQGSDIVFSHLNGTQIQSFNRAWWATLKIAGIEDFHFHDLRHTFCSNLILSGAGLKEVKEMTDRYSHLTINHKLLRQRQLAEHYKIKNCGELPDIS